MVEDHYPQGGIGAAVLEARRLILHLGSSFGGQGTSRVGQAEELMNAAGILEQAHRRGGHQARGHEVMAP